MLACPEMASIRPSQRVGRRRTLEVARPQNRPLVPGSWFLGPSSWLPGLVIRRALEFTPSYLLRRRGDVHRKIKCVHYAKQITDLIIS